VFPLKLVESLPQPDDVIPVTAAPKRFVNQPDNQDQQDCCPEEQDLQVTRDPPQQREPLAHHFCPDFTLTSERPEFSKRGKDL
jgi:hypothetical protein